jgi:hypothetical protein
MGEVDQNLNYMLGQLSLVVQEFNQVSITQCATTAELEFLNSLWGLCTE